MSSKSCNAAHDISAVDRAGVPGVGCAVDGFDGHGGCTSILGGNGECLVQVTEETFNADRLVVVPCCRFAFDFQDGTHSCEDFAELGSSIGTDQSAHADSEEYLLHEDLDDGGCGGVAQFGDDNEAGEVVHDGKEILVTVDACGCAWLPNV